MIVFSLVLVRSEGEWRVGRFDSSRSFTIKRERMIDRQGREQIRVGFNMGGLFILCGAGLSSSGGIDVVSLARPISYSQTSRPR